MQYQFPCKHITGWFIGGIAILILAFGCSTTGPQPKMAPEPSAKFPAGKNVVQSKTDAAQIKAGDLVSVHYTLRLEESNEVINTTSKKIAGNSDEKKANWYKAPESFEAEEVIAGDETFMPEISKRVLGMCPGAKETIFLSPEKGFGQPDPKKKMRLPLIKKIPKKALVKPQQYVERFGRFPKVGERVDLTPYFKSRVSKVENEYVVLEAEIDKGDTIEHDFGITTITFQEDDIVMTIEPIIGGLFELRGQKGRIIDSDTETFTVDFNHPGAGKNLLLDIEVVAVEKADQFVNSDLQWIEDHDKGYAKASENKKPMVMVLYADWCGWCKKMLNNTVNDPRIQKLWNEFVWVKVNSDKEKEYKEFYEQKGYPMVVMTDAEGEIINRFEGFRDARIFRHELNKALKIFKETKQA